jgi:hypothetical protein
MSTPVKSNVSIARASNLPAPKNWQAAALAPTFNALDLMPDECAPSVAKLYLCNQIVLQSALALCSTIRVYLDETNVTPGDINDICARLLRPERRQHHKFASDLMTDLARMVDERAKKNTAAEEARERAKPAVRLADVVNLADLFKPD